MTRTAALAGVAAILVTAVASWPAAAGSRRGDNAVIWPIAPWSRSATVVASDGCWRACEAQCGRQTRKCVRAIGLTDCLPHNDSCGRICVKYCRTSGGPLLNWTD